MALSFEELKILACLNRAAAAKGVREAALLFGQGWQPSRVCDELLTRGVLSQENLFPAAEIFDAGKEIERCAEANIHLSSLLDEGYPAFLREIPDAPLLLYVKGQLLAADRAAVGIVGSRNPSFYGLEQATRFGRELAAGGLTVVSGLARGIDQAAHEGCLSVPYGRTLAVLGCGVDQIYPPENGRLFSMIAERGAILSEFPLGTRPLAWNFPRRNRILSGLSLAVLVVEAHLRSGSLITARLAAEQGREVFAMPGPVDQWTSRGTHQLLKEGAVLVENAGDIFEDLKPCLESLLPALQETPVFAAVEDSVAWDSQPSVAPAVPAPTEKQAGGPLNRELLESLNAGPLAADEIITQTQHGAAEVLSALAVMEMAGEVVKNRDGRFEQSGVKY